MGKLKIVAADFRARPVTMASRLVAPDDGVLVPG
jgi:hypothetical protein